jgi:nicotinate (nicotinamide) nucleotide adenylyltransferase
MKTDSPYNDLKLITAIREALAPLDPSAEPRTHFFTDRSDLRLAKRVGVLSGSFNPLTNAHIALAGAAQAQIPLDTVVFTMSKVTVDKESVTEASLDDRLLVLRRYAREKHDYEVAAINRGLYADQVEAMHSALPEAEFCFIVGLDKALQIIDPRYYDDFNESLNHLFDNASLAIAPRGEESLQGLLERMNILSPAHRKRIRFIDLPSGFRYDSSSDIRGMVERGRYTADLVPQETLDFIEATYAYMPPLILTDGSNADRYAMRSTLLDVLSSAPQLSRSPDIDLLLRVAFEDSERGKTLRELLESTASSAAASRILSFIRHFDA